MGAAAETQSISGQSKIEISFVETSTDGIGNVSRSPVNTGTDSELAYSNGTGSLQARRQYKARVTLTPASGTFDLDLSTMLDPYGITINPSKIRILYIKNRSDAGGGNLLIGAASSNPWIAPWASSGAPTTVKQTLEPGGEFFHSAPRTGLAVSATSKTLRFTHGGGSSGSIVFDIYLLCI